MSWKTPTALNTQWPNSIDNQEEKQRIANMIATLAQDGQIIGAGSGSTAFLTLQALAQTQKNITIIPTSYEIEHYALAMGLTVTSLRHNRPDWCFDGADEVDEHGNMIKGRGGALLREKLVMRSAGRIYILVDHTKIVRHLGAKFPVPVEVLPEALFCVEDDLNVLGAKSTTLRLAGKGKDGPVITEKGNFLLDVEFENLTQELSMMIKNITGIVETGLFYGFDPVIVTPDSNPETLLNM